METGKKMREATNTKASNEPELMMDEVVGNKGDKAIVGDFLRL